MEGDAGAGRLNPPPMSMNRRLRRRRPRNEKESDAADQASTDTSPEAATADSQESAETTEPAAADIAPDAVTQVAPVPAAEPAREEPAAAAEAPPLPETDVDTEAALGDSAEESTDQEADTGSGTDAEAAAVVRGASRLGRGWLIGIAATLVVLAGAVGTGGYLAQRFHQETKDLAHENAVALKVAMDCVAATQAPDTNAMTASEQKIIDCGTDAFRSQAVIYTAAIVQAYQAANIHVQVSDSRGAVERNNPDGSVDVLVALRVKVASDKEQNEISYRLRVKMVMAEGQYRISKLDQVTK